MNEHDGFDHCQGCQAEYQARYPCRCDPIGTLHETWCPLVSTAAFLEREA